MDEVRHTPGPWTAKCRDSRYAGGPWSDEEFLQWDVIGPRGHWGRGDYLQGDALLVAAAPDLLTEGKALRSFLWLLIEGTEIDAETTEIDFKSDGKHLTTVKLADVLKRWDEAVAKATVPPTGPTPWD